MGLCWLHLEFLCQSFLRKWNHHTCREPCGEPTWCRFVVVDRRTPRQSRIHVWVDCTGSGMDVDRKRYGWPAYPGADGRIDAWCISDDCKAEGPVGVLAHEWRRHQGLVRKSTSFDCICWQATPVQL